MPSSSRVLHSCHSQAVSCTTSGPYQARAQSRTDVLAMYLRCNYYGCYTYCALSMYLQAELADGQAVEQEREDWLAQSLVY